DRSLWGPSWRSPIADVRGQTTPWAGAEFPLMELLGLAGSCERAFTRWFREQSGGTDAGHALLSFWSKISWVCVTMAASLPSLRVMRVSSTMVVRPRCSGMQTARAGSPFGTPAKKLVLLSMVAVLPPSATVILSHNPPS